MPEWCPSRSPPSLCRRDRERIRACSLHRRFRSARAETRRRLAHDQLRKTSSRFAGVVHSSIRSLRLVVKTQVEPSSMASTILQEVRAIDPTLPGTAVQTMTDVVRTSAATPRFNTLLVGAFALLALLLAGIGIAGVLATSVSRRTQELGVRLALGARPRTLLAMILREGLALAAIGLAVGWPVAWMLSRVMGSLLFEVHPRDPVAFGGAAALMVVVAVA